MKFLIPILSRYGSILVQFALVTLIARTLPPHDAGAYFLISGVVLSIYFLAGLGIPDGLVAATPVAAVTGGAGAVRNLTMKGLTYSCALSTLVPISTFIVVRSVLNDLQIASHAAIWSAGYSLTFIASQTLVSMKKVQWGSFIFYSAINACLCFSTIPYLIFAASPTLHDTLAINAYTALLAGVAALALTIWQIRKLEKGKTPACIGDLWRNGVLISLGRVVQSAILWMPVWIAGVILTSSDAAQLGLAGRLLSIVGALLAAIRFSIRPTIAFLAIKKDWREIERISSEVAFIASAFALAAMGLTWIFGQDLIQLAFGPSYQPVATLLLILLGATLAESVGGTVDETLKMSMRSGVVLTSQITALAFMITAGVPLTIHFGAAGAALASALSFGVMYGIQIARTFRLYGIVSYPKFPSRNRKISAVAD